MQRLKILTLQPCVVLIVLEVCLRLYNPFPFRVRGDRIVLPVRQAYTFHNQGATKLDPVTRHTKNSLGFRGPEPPRDFATRLTLLTIGGSTTECLFLSDGKTWTDVLARTLARVWPDMWVNNAGLDGQSSYGHLVLIRDFVATLRPKMALFLIGANDVGLEESNTYDASLTPYRPAWRQAGVFLASHSEVVGLAQNLLRVSRAKDRGFGHSQVDLTAARHLVLDGEVMEATAEKYRPTLVPFAHRLKALVDLCRANQIDPVFISQPALFGDVVDVATGVNLATVQVNGRGNGTLEWRLLELYNDVTRKSPPRSASSSSMRRTSCRRTPACSTISCTSLNEGAARLGEIVAAELEPYLQRQPFAVASARPPS